MPVYTADFSAFSFSSSALVDRYSDAAMENDAAIPVISPFIVKPEYNPNVEDELLKPLGALNEDNIVVLVSVTVPADVEKISANIKAPFILNSDAKKGIQLIIENPDYEVKYRFYEKLKAYKASKEGK